MGVAAAKAGVGLSKAAPKTTEWLRPLHPEDGPCMTKTLSSGLGPARLSGRIDNYRCIRESAHFVFSNADQAALGVVAIAAGVAGLAGQAIAAASYADDAEEPADRLTFTINGQSVRGWVWRSPFAEGDVVDVVGAWDSDHFELVAIRRSSDRTIALYPHCTRGRRRHVMKACFWWAAGTSVFNGAIVLTMVGSFGMTSLLEAVHEGAGYFILGVYIFFAVAVTSMAWKWMSFARLSERIFKALDMSDPGGVDLVRRTRQVRLASDPGELGVFYFKY